MGLTHCHCFLNHTILTVGQDDSASVVMVDYCLNNTVMDDSDLGVVIGRCAQILHLAATGRNMAGDTPAKRKAFVELVSVAADV